MRLFPPDPLDSRESDATYDRDEFALYFETLSTRPPFVRVRSKLSGVHGTLQFRDSPRVYFGWKAEEG